VKQGSKKCLPVNKLIRKHLTLLTFLILLIPASNGIGQETDKLGNSLQQLQNIQEGLILTLAACSDEAHCVTALNQHEIEIIQQNLDQLAEQLTNTTSEQQALIQHLNQLRTSYINLQKELIQVTEQIDRDSLDGNWADKFVFDEFVIGTTVPFPNEDILLSRFEDLNEPLPIE